jgi:PAS domain S-box-containing protein
VPDQDTLDRLCSAPGEDEALRLAILSLEVSADCVYWFDSATRIVYANAAASRMLGYSREELARMAVADINPTCPADIVALAARMEVDTAPQTYETVHRHKDGRLIPVEVTTAPLAVGAPRYVAVAARDISSRRWMEAAASNIAGELDRFFDVAVEMLCIIDQRGFLRRLNPAWERALGYTRDELMARPLLEFVHPDDRQATDEAVGRLASSAAVGTFSSRYQQKGGGYCWLEWRAVSGGDKIYGAATDVTRRMASEAALRRANESVEAATNAKHVFLNSISHELRTPLNVVVGMSHLALATDLTPQQRDYLTKLQASASALTELVSRSLERSELGTEAGPPAPDPDGADPLPGQAPDPRPRVLVVDDNRLNLRVAREMLQRLGMVVETANNGREAVEAMRRGPDRFDVILMDIQMPEMDGLEATRVIRREFPHRAVPIVAATANALRSERAACLEAGMNDYVSKPIDPKRLEAALSPWVTRAKPAPVTPARQVPPPSPQLAAVRGVDIGSALARLNGKHDLFARLLRGFVEEHRAAAAAIAAAIARDDIVAALRLVHDLKGVAGTLSANAVYESARALEASMRQGQRENLAAQVERLTVALDVVCRSVSEWPGDAVAPAPPTERLAPEWSAISADLAEFDRLLKNRRFSARKQFERVKAHAAAPELKCRLDEIQGCLDRLDFQAAREQLCAVAAALCPTPARG